MPSLKKCLGLINIVLEGISNTYERPKIARNEPSEESEVNMCEINDWTQLGQKVPNSWFDISKGIT